jgi:hypothetical protein
VASVASDEQLEHTGDASLDLLAKAHVMAVHKNDDVRILNPMAEDLLRNKTLWRRAKAFGIPSLALFRPFEKAVRLPALTKQLVAPKAQADLMEAMMGAACQTQIEQQNKPNPLARGLDAALAFFNAFICEAEAAVDCGSATELLAMTMRMERRSEAPPAAGCERAHDISAMLGVEFKHRADLLAECCVWHGAKEDGLVFQRLELLGDAFLQCTRARRTRRRCCLPECTSRWCLPLLRMHPITAVIRVDVCACDLMCAYGSCCHDGAASSISRQARWRADAHALSSRE